MQGLIFHELKDFVQKKLGTSGWDEVRSLAGIETTLYASVQVYPDQELLALMQATAKKLDMPLQEMLEEFGQYFISNFIHTRAYLISPHWGILEMLEHAPEVVEKVEHRYQVDSPPVVLRCKRDRIDQLTMVYNSKRRMCAFVKGIIKGLGQYYHTQIELEEPRCLLKGQSDCTLIVRVVPSSVPVQEALSD